ncbi:hypothetical protein [Ralstonia mannitolilytica]|uniref:hypothetical protein n=1 Tax=Ralstonia mannitolilytica TaxID=105219 RepID=UPI00292EA68D|nr:hypothetical protein [Ralstonia mannitolilytica]
MFDVLSQGGLDDLQVQFDQLFDAFKCLVGQAEEGFQVGLVRRSDLFLSQDVVSPNTKVGRGIKIKI